MRLVVVSNRLPFTVSFTGGNAAIQAQRGRVDHRAVELSGSQSAGWRGTSGLSVDGLARREHSAGTRGGGAGLCRAAVQVQPGFFAGGKHGPVLSRLLQQDHLAAVPLFPDADALRGGKLAGIPERQPRLRRGGGERAAPGRRAVDSRLPPDAAAEAGARKIPGNAHRLFPAHPVSVLGNFPDAAAAVARGNHRGTARCEPDRFSHARLCAGFSDLGAAHGRL